ncbi:hypothetical protein CYY_002343 [Polysphondylium violaceum]|uniref:non-specific serine/threonine protein kinase n=1 Tax=Polysphondylium violaceum TaxID=133409 RepID=A0A8J4V6Z5_9MYCE|nr:hypothetical protein CYY_002343 [Polysphondylium violaceum]
MEENGGISDFKLPEGIKDPSVEFDLLECLGRGSFGSVFKAVHKRTGYIVAVKLVPVNEDFQEILKEINIMKQCRSKYVVQYFGNYFKDETCWIIMEYCALGSVSDMMNVTNRILNEEQIALVCYSVLKGLYYLHKNSKIHRDIKPGNILVTLSGECKLADFGVSGQLSERTRKRNTVIGTPFFLAPEVIQEVGYDNKADIWALGISAIEMAEFHPPYHDLHPMRVLFMIPTAPSPTLKDSTWSPEFSDFIRLCLAKEQSQRPSAKELLKHPFFEKKVKGTYVMKSLTDTAQMIIDRCGGREQAIKEAHERKSKQSGEPVQFIHCETVDEPDSSSDEEDLLEKNNKMRNSVGGGGNNNGSNRASPVIAGNNNSSTNNSNQQNKDKNDINELDSLLNGIMLSSNNNNNNNNNNSSNRPISGSSSNNSNSTNYSSNNNNNINNNNYNSTISGSSATTTSSIPKSTTNTTSPIQASMGFSKQLSNSSFPVSPNTVPSKPIEQKPKPPASELDDLLEEMLNPSFGSKPRGLTPISSPAVPKRLSTNISPSISTTCRISGVWSGANAGGCANTPQWRNNPQFLLQCNTNTSVRVSLRQTGDKLVHIGFYFTKANSLSSADVFRKRITLTKEVLVPGIDITFLRNTEISAKTNIEAGNYIIIPATFEPGQEGSFELEVIPSNPSDLVKLTEITPDRDWKLVSRHMEWRGQSAGGSFSGSSGTWKENPKLFFEITQPSTMTIVLGKMADISKETYTGFYVFKAEKSTPYIFLTATNLVAKTSFINGSEVLHTQSFQAGAYIIVPCTYDAQQEGSFTLNVYCDSQINVLSLDDQITTVHGEWRALTAGGCLNHTTWRNNMQFLVSNNANSPTKVTIMLEQLEKNGNSTLPFVGFYIAKANYQPPQSKKVYSLTPKDIVGNTEFINDYQVHFTCIMEPQSSYIIIPSTFTPGIEYPFNIRVASNTPAPNIVRIVPLPSFNTKKLDGEWKGPSCGGRYSNTSSSWTLNPRFQFNLPKGGRYCIILSQSDKSSYHGIGFYYFKTQPDGTLSEFICKSGFVCGKEIVLEGHATESIRGVIIPATFDAGIPDHFNVTIYSEFDYDFYN